MVDFDDFFDDPVDPLNPLHPFFFAQWHCPDCAEDGDKDELVAGKCPNCGSKIESIP